MSFLSAAEISKYLDHVRELQRSHVFCDVHVHPYEVLLDRFEYMYGKPADGILSVDRNEYVPPSCFDLRFDQISAQSQAASRDYLQRSYLVVLRRLYGHIGAKVFLDQMALCGIGKILLLPVASEHGVFDEKMAGVSSLYDCDGRFFIAGSVPNAVSDENVGRYVSGLKKKFNIKALKCHPVISAMDLASEVGKDRLGSMLAACEENHLPLVLHCGGRSSLWSRDRGGYALLENVRDIDWNVSSEPVVIAHAGMYSCELTEAENEVLPILARMLEKFDNLFVDISGIDIAALSLVLKRIDNARIVFGSDALYHPQWASMVTLLHVLKNVGTDVDRRLIEIASTNPLRTIFRMRSLT